MTESVETLVIIFTAFVLGGLVKGVIGMGLPTVAVGVMGLVLTPARAAALLVLPSLVTNVWQFFTGPQAAVILRRLWSLQLGVCVGVFAGSGLLTDASGRATIALGVLLMLYAALGLSSVHFLVPQRAEWWLSPIVGLATGVITAATGIFVVPAVPYLQSLALDRDQLVQALGLSFTVATLALGAVLIQLGIFSSNVAAGSALALAPALLGMLTGQWLRHRISATAFRYCMFVGLLVLGAHLASRAYR
jgi:uncharacterized protein